MFYHYSQNNSGGSFDINNQLTVNVVIEADSAEDADRKLEDLGGYFHGCHTGRDCECCGDRWSNAWENDGTEKAEVYGNSPADYIKSRENRAMLWAEKGKNVVVYYKNGVVEWY